ncbi:mCG140808 [Mus musculus]|nr:mCG140808 [Mus musculus]
MSQAYAAGAKSAGRWTGPSLLHGWMAQEYNGPGEDALRGCGHWFEEAATEGSPVEARSCRN